MLTISLGIMFFSICSAADNTKWVGVDEAVIEKLAKEHGREAAKPLIDIEQGDLMLFCFLVAGVIGGFTAGYYWRTLSEEKEQLP
jgi:cobalt/nickel transport protein